MKFGGSDEHGSEFWLQGSPTQVRTTASNVAQDAVAGRCEAGEKLIKGTSAFVM